MTAAAVDPAARWAATSAAPIVLHAGDVVLVRGSSWLSRQILSATRDRGEEPSVVSHVGLIQVGGALPDAEILEATGRRVVRSTMRAAYGASSSGVAIARPIALTREQLDVVLAVSARLEGRAYGFGKLPLHLLDAWLGRLVRARRTPILFRRLGRSPLPICSWHVAAAYAAIGYRFGRTGAYAAPDDIYDAILADASSWSWVLGPNLLPLSIYLKQLDPKGD